MADRARVPIDGDATVDLRGVTTSQHAVAFSQLKRRDVCRVTLDTGAVKLKCLFFDNLAQDAAAVARGSEVHVTGKLVQHEWETGDMEKRDCLMVEAETLEVVRGS